MPVPPFNYRGNSGGELLPTVPSNEPIVGYRVWRVSNLEGLHLRSLSMSYVWDVDNTAICLPKTKRGDEIFQGKHPKKKAPEEECECGLYSQLPETPIDEWHFMVRKMVRASGVVKQYGKVLKCAAGFKAERAIMESPVILEAGCAHDVTGEQCSESPTALSPLPIGQYKGYCDIHASEIPHEEQKALLPLESWMKVACDELEERYPGIEFLSWYHL